MTPELRPHATLEPLLTQLGYDLMVLQRNLEGVSHADSLLPPQPGGNCLNWVVGHLVATRNRWLAALGLPQVIDPARVAAYARGAAPSAGGVPAVPLAELLAAFAAAQGPIAEGMRRLGAEELAAPAPFSPVNDPRETLGSLLTALCFHEAYHLGQTGLLRRIAGHPGAIR